MLTIGITGTLGAGKGTIVEYLVEIGFKHLSVRDLLTKEIKKRSLSVNRDSMVAVANDLRRKFGPSYLAETLYNKAKNSKKNCVIESLRTPAEIDSLKKRGNFYLFAVDAKPRQRYLRIQKRGSVTDKVSYKEFLANEKRELTSSDPTKQNLAFCILMADFKFDNNKGYKDLYVQIEKALSEIQKRKK